MLVEYTHFLRDPIYLAKRRQMRKAVDKEILDEARIECLEAQEKYDKLTREYYA